ERGQDRAQVAAVAAADDTDGRAVHAAVAGEQVVGGEQVAQVVAARNRLVLRLRFGVAPQVEGQAHTAQGSDLARPGQVLLLTAAPAVDEEYARGRAAIPLRLTISPRGRGQVVGGQQRTRDVLAVDGDVEEFIAYEHGAPPWCTW